MTRARAARARGVALLALVAVIGLAASWMLVSRLYAESGGVEAARKQRNAEVLNRAKQALIGYVAQRASRAGEDDPGSLPCPEAAGYFGNPATEGQAAGNCSLPAVGRFPWRTLGTEKLVDASGEPLWYVVASGWAKPNATTNTIINSNCTSDATMACHSGQLTVDGAPRTAVALIIAPGPAFAVAANAAAGCTARAQVRPPAGPLDARNYLECENASVPADATFVTRGPAGSFNDQAIALSAAELLPAIEAAIAHRIEREIAPAIRAAYNAPNWGLAGTDRVYPYAAPFTNPSTASYTGAAANTQGLLPLAYMETYPGSGTACTAGPAAPRCSPTLVRWANAAPSMSYTGTGVTLTPFGCWYSGPTGAGECMGIYTGLPTSLTISGPQTNGAMSLRQINAGVTGYAWFFDLTSGANPTSSPSPAVTLNSNGTFAVSVTATPPAPAGVAGVVYWLRVPGNATRDHSLLDARASGCVPDPPGCPATSWFIRNRWHELAYYAVAPGYTAAAAAPRTCTAGTDCLAVANYSPPPANDKRALLILAGRSINGAVRPSSALSDYLEFGNAAGAFERQPVSTVVDAALKKPFNDRVVVVDSN
jgi:hypothetical protein